MQLTEALEPDPIEDERPDELAELLSEWIDTDPNMTDDYRQQKASLAQSLLRYDDIAAKFREVSAPVLYRGISLRKPRFNLEQHLLVKPRRTDVFESWTMQRPMADLHAMRPWLVDASLRTRTMSRSAYPFIIAEQVARLPIWINISTFMHWAGKTTNEGEVLVRAAPRAYARVYDAPRVPGMPNRDR